MARRGRINLQRRRLLVTALLATLLLSAAPGAGARIPSRVVERAAPRAQTTAVPPQGGRTYLPGARQVFQGVTDEPVAAYTAATGKHPAVYQEFLAWGEWLPGITNNAANARARLVVAIGTASGTREMITPARLAAGAGDAWLIGLNREFAAFGHPVYVRLMAEMDGYWNPYCAFNANGSSRGPSHSPAAYRQAWRRVALILRGGPVSGIDAVLHRLGMPPVNPSATARGLGIAPLQGATALPQPQVAMLWVPQTAGDPLVPGNQPRAYWPGRAWVDWVGTDFYSKFPNFAGLSSFYSRFSGKPFVFGEYALWGADDPGFVARLFSWVSSHRRVRMMIYNQGAQTYGPFRLIRYPRASRALRGRLASPRFPDYAPDWRQP